MVWVSGEVDGRGCRKGDRIMDCSYCSVPTDTLFNDVVNCIECRCYMCEECIIEEQWCPECYETLKEKEDEV